MLIKKEFWIEDILKELEEENVAVFAGAGLSMSAGYVGWSELLEPIAKEIGLDVKKEYDLVTLAQYHVNENGNNKSQLNKSILWQKIGKDFFGAKVEV